jgi:predicted DNA-binding transcriptional regulator AlpA
MTARRRTRPHVEKRAFRVNAFCAAYGLGRTKVYDLIKREKLRTVLVDGRRLIHFDDAEALFSVRPS